MQINSVTAKPMMSPANPASGAQLLAANLVRLRAEKGLSQADLAARLGVAVVAIEALEAGWRADPRLDEIDALVQALAIAPHELFAPLS